MHHTLRKDLIKDILVWSGVFFSILGVIFILSINSLVDYMLSEMASDRMSYQTVEFAKHLSQGDQKSIDEESHALVQDKTLSAMIVIDGSGLIAHVSLHADEPPSLAISPNMTVTKMRGIIHSISHLRLYEAPIPGHQATLAIIMDKRPVLRSVYRSTLWTVILLFTLVGISVLALHYSLRRHLIEPIDEVKHILDDDLSDEEKQDIISHLPDEVASLAHSYEDTYKSHELMERQFLQAQKMEAIGTLVGGIAHDFNNILAGMTGSLHLAKKKVQDPYVLQKLTSIEQLSFRAADMIQQLLTFARKDMVNIKQLPLTPFIKEALKFIRTSVPENIEIHQNICSDALQINGDDTQLHQVLLNLVNNARDALEGVDDPCITIRLEAFDVDDTFIESHAYFKAGLHAHISVEDNGCGIPEDQIEHLFEPFFTTKEVGKGTGLGLAMVFGAIKTHHGFVEVESIEGEGSTFHIYLPLIEEGKIAVTSEPLQQTIEGHGELILVVDDDAIIRSVSKEVLENTNYRVVEAANGLEAIDIFTAHQDEISLIIMDIVMPRLGGVKTVERIKKIRPDIKVIFSTGYDKDAALKNNVPSSENVILSKPYNIAELSKTIRNQLDS